MAKHPGELLPLPEPPPDQPTGVRLKAVPPSATTGPPWWAWVLIGLMLVGLGGGAVLLIQRNSDAAKASQSRALSGQQVRLARRTDCALKVASTYEDQRDDVIQALGDGPLQGRAAAQEFGAFRLPPNAKPGADAETREQRTIRLCGTAADAIHDRGPLRTRP